MLDCPQKDSALLFSFSLLRLVMVVMVVLVVEMSNGN